MSAALTIPLALSAALLIKAEYAETKRARGSLIPVGGMLQVKAPRPGWIGSLLVREGQSIKAMTPLVQLVDTNFDQHTSASKSSVLGALEGQDRILNAQQAELRSAASRQRGNLTLQVRSLKGEIGDLERQIGIQIRLLEMARSDIEQASALTSKGFISRRDMGTREETLLSRQQRLLEMQQGKRGRQSQLLVLEGELAQVDTELHTAITALLVSKAQLVQQQATVTDGQRLTLRAPLSGRIGALSLHVGDAVEAQQALMTIIPSGGGLIARIRIPTRSVGSIAVGSGVDLSVDAFPYGHFGTLRAVVTSVPGAPVVETDENGRQSSYYIVLAEIMASRTRGIEPQQLKPGMELEARWSTRRHPLIYWLLGLVDVSGQ